MLSRTSAQLRMDYLGDSRPLRTCHLVQLGTIASAMLALVLALTFSASKTYLGGRNGPSPEIHSSLKRRLLDQNNGETVEQITTKALQPGTFFKALIVKSIKPPKEYAPVREFPFTRPLLRLKIGPPGSNSSDPFI